MFSASVFVCEGLGAGHRDQSHRHVGRAVRRECHWARRMAQRWLRTHNTLVLEVFIGVADRR